MSAEDRPWEQAFTPSPEVLELLPEITGNDINGLGEDAFRCASPVLWHDPDILAHGDLQNWFFVNGCAPGADANRMKNEEFLRQPIAAVAAVDEDVEERERERVSRA